MRSRRSVILVITLIAVVGAAYTALPYFRAGSFIVRAANMGGRIEAVADSQAPAVTVQPRHVVPTRYGDVPAQFYTPDKRPDRTVLLVPGIHSMGIDEPRLTALAKDLAGSGVTVMTMALPDLQTYKITPRATDVIEDAVAWMSKRPDLAPDEPYVLARGPGRENALLYLAVPPSLIAQVRGLSPLARVIVSARVRNGHSAPVGTPLLDLLSMRKP